MADTTVSSNNRVIEFENKFFLEYTRDSRFKRFMGADQNSIINVNENLTKKQGDRINMPLVGALDASAGANDGSSTLVGNEKALPNAGHRIDIGVVRDAIVVNVEEEQASAFDVANAGKSALKTLAMEYIRNGIMSALHTIDGVVYGTATEVQKDTWLTANDDRVLFGAALANGVSNDHSVALATIDNTADKLSTSIVSLAKRMAVKPTAPASKPVSVDEDTEGFVMFCPTEAFRDISEDSTMTQANREARNRGIKNPLFRDGDLIWKNVVIREIPELPILTGVGAAGIDVAPCFLCKSQAVGVAWAQRTKMTFRKEDDYQFEKGVGFMELRGIEKLQYLDGADLRDWGVVTVYVAGVADA